MASISNTNAIKTVKSLIRADVTNIKDQVYENEVIYITRQLLVLSILLRNKCQRLVAMAEARPYNKSILKQDIGRREHLRRC